MATLFISHSSNDKELVRQLAVDLRELGHAVWLDEWEIRVGDCIVSKVEQGLRDADYVVLVLSKHATESGWVEREWRTKYWEEVEKKRPVILPVLIEDCDVPALLNTKKYADFRKNPRVGLAALVLAISPVVLQDSTALQITPVPPTTSVAGEAAAILVRLNSGSVPLAQSFAETLALARRAGNDGVANFCVSELGGYDGDVPEWRVVDAYASVTAAINPQYWGFSGGFGPAIDAMAADTEHFTKIRLSISFALAEVEGRRLNEPEKGLMVMKLNLRDVNAQAKTPDAEVRAYFPGDTYRRILVSARAELTRRVMELTCPSEKAGNRDGST